MKPKSRSLEPSRCKSSSARSAPRVDSTRTACYHHTWGLTSFLVNNPTDRWLGPDWTLGQEQLPGSAAYGFSQLPHLAVLHRVCQHRFQKLQQQHYSSETVIQCTEVCIAGISFLTSCSSFSASDTQMFSLSLLLRLRAEKQVYMVLSAICSCVSIEIVKKKHSYCNFRNRNGNG